MKPSFPKDPVMRNEAGKIIMEAIVRSDPHGKPTWFHEKKEVKDGGRFHMGSEEQKDGTILYSLAVTTPKKEDAGAYTLTVTNKSGDNSAKFSLNVGPPPGSGDIAPEFSSDPKIYANADNSLITLECQVKSKPDPTSAWNQEEKEVKEDSRKKFVVSSLGDNKFAIKLEIKNPQAADGGKYKCTAKNKYGSCYAYLSLKF